MEISKILVLDAEIEKGILMKGEDRLPEIEYCNGWRDFAGMGISVVGAWQSDTERYRTFSPKQDPEPLREAVRNAHYVVTWNGFNFDGPLLAHYGVEIPEEKHLDLLRQVWAANRLSGSYSSGTHAGFGLDACAKANQVMGKTGHGALAPVMWQRGQYTDVIDYCLHDIWITRALLLKMMRGEFKSPKTLLPLAISLPPLTLFK